ncbi:hypothetical protein GSI_10533 [Ganoderma sinense ZZ0214-1]|uniref:Uncharacterized protein n=1 Tax=Ganoderma sinense ZZ0214-1 TaxID=1077348 RepID=A0A2G8S0V7_9APHY|nr:hypothetical protein GSI_10533 [Ganoderma sinense ZZ0214-1]
MADAEVATPATIEINDACFCQHFKEVCETCQYDGREENDTFFGVRAPCMPFEMHLLTSYGQFDPIDREGLEAPMSSTNKEGVYQCKKHGSATCNQCYGWKKQITRARAAAKKAGKKA